VYVGDAVPHTPCQRDVIPLESHGVFQIAPQGGQFGKPCNCKNLILDKNMETVPHIHSMLLHLIDDTKNCIEQIIAVVIRQADLHAEGFLGFSDGHIIQKDITVPADHT